MAYIRIKSIIVMLLASIATNCFSQVKLKKLDKASIPRSIQYKGNLQSAVSWTDSLGNNIVLTTETGEFPDKNGEPGYRQGALYAHHYLIKPDSVKLLWQVHDYVDECPVDIHAEYIENTFAVTDLDKDGTGEVWLMYKIGCRGDVSPIGMKIVMTEGGKKHIIRGRSRLQVAEKSFEGGEYKLDDAFRRAMTVFRNYAEQLWKKNMAE